MFVCVAILVAPKSSVFFGRLSIRDVGKSAPIFVADHGAGRTTRPAVGDGERDLSASRRKHPPEPHRLVCHCARPASRRDADWSDRDGRAPFQPNRSGCNRTWFRDLPCGDLRRNVAELREEFGEVPELSARPIQGRSRTQRASFRRG